MSNRKLGRTSSQRKAMLRDLTTDLIINETIVTTEARAKEVRRTVEKMITLGKKGDLSARRAAAAYVRNEIAIKISTKKLKLSQLPFKNYSTTLLNATKDVTVVTLVSLKLNHVVVMLRLWQSLNWFNFIKS